MQPLSDPDLIYNINPIFMSCSLQCMKSQSEKVIKLDKIVQNCILNSINHLSQFLEISCLALCFKCLPEEKKIKKKIKGNLSSKKRQKKTSLKVHCIV